MKEVYRNPSEVVRSMLLDALDVGCEPLTATACSLHPLHRRRTVIGGRPTACAFEDGGAQLPDVLTVTCDYWKQHDRR